MNDLAGIYLQQGRFEEAQSLFDRSISIAKNALGANHPHLGAMLNSAAESYRVQGRYAEAEPLYKRALAISMDVLDPAHPEVGKMLGNLALLYGDQGRYTEVEPLLKRAIEIAEKALGPEDPGLITALSNLAALHRRLRRFPESERHYKRAVTIAEKALDTNHPSVGTVLNNLAILYMSTARYSEAEPLLKRTILILESTMGPNHPDIGTVINNLAEVYRRQDRGTEAEAMYQRAIEIGKESLGQNHATVGIKLNNLASFYHLLGRYTQAEPLYGRSITTLENALGPDHAEVSAPLTNLAELYKKQGRFEEETKVRSRLAQMPAPGTRHIPVYYATTRAFSDQVGGYSGDASNGISFGRVTMQVPAEAVLRQGEKRADALGQLDQSRAELSAADVFKSIRQRSLSEDQFAESIKASMARTALFKKQALVFVHGFNVDFDEAAQRTSQIAFDLEFDGALIAFSWPSLGNGDPVSYGLDRSRADDSVDRFVAFLDQASAQLPDVTFHILAHSMGNRILARALSKIAARPESSARPKLGEVILAHADADPEWCVELGKARHIVRGITNYVNQDDWALLASKALRIGKERCGRLPRVYDGIETIDTTGMGGKASWKTLLFGQENHHGVFANDPLLFGEITRLIASGQRPPHERTAELAKREDDEGRLYWAYDPALDIAVVEDVAQR